MLRSVPRRLTSYSPIVSVSNRPQGIMTKASVEVRELLKGQDLSFTEIAKVVGERWQVLPADEREACERQANGAKEKYYAELAEYKKTPHYEAYQKYLEDFKAKHNAPTKGLFPSKMPTLSNRLVTVLEGKRSRLETETSMSTRGSSYDQHERAVNRRLSAAITDLPTGQRSSGSTPPTLPARLPAGPSYPSKPTSPASHSMSGFNSPRSGELYSPITASPRSNGLHRDAAFDASSGHPTREMRGNLDPTTLYHPSVYVQPHPAPSNMTPMNHYAPHYQSVVDLPSRRSIREPGTHLPSLSHEDTTLSSESGHSNYSLPQTTQPPQMDLAKSSRMLPQPVPSIGPTQSPLDRKLTYPPPGPPTHLQLPPPDYRTQGSFAALIRAGEIVSRVADDEFMMKDGSP